MGEVHVNMNITLDGVIQANGGPTEQDGDFAYAGWERPFGDRESLDQLVADIRESDALLLGRTTYDIFRGYWPGKTDDIGVEFDRVPKYVASRGTPELTWEESTQLTDVVEGVRELRRRHERIHTWGSADMLQSLWAARLVDRVNLRVSPVVLGHGKKLFPEGTTPTRFELAEPPRSYPGGSLLLRLRRREGPPLTD